jgi:hypothetical protein
VRVAESCEVTRGSVSVGGETFPLVNHESTITHLCANPGDECLGCSQRIRGECLVLWAPDDDGLWRSLCLKCLHRFSREAAFPNYTVRTWKMPDFPFIVDPDELRFARILARRGVPVFSDQTEAQLRDALLASDDADVRYVGEQFYAMSIGDRNAWCDRMEGK